MIRYERVSVRYAGAERPAADGVSFEARRGAITALAGPNGSGKSTLVLALLRRRPLADGRILVDGAALDALDRRELARRVAAVTQREETTWPRPVQEYVALGRYPHAGRWGAPGPADQRAVRDAMELADVAELAERDTGSLSGGEWQRVRIARALAQGGDALVLDEPTTFLDVAHEMATFELLAALAGRGMAVLVVSHQLNLVARFAHEVVLLSGGRVAAAGPADEVMRGSVLEDVYRWPLVVIRDPAVGAPALLPLRRSARR